MDWDEIARNPILVENFAMFRDVGILDYVDQQKREINNIDNLLEEAYELFRMESVDQIVDYVLWRLSDKFIPSSVYIILNEGIMVNKIKTIAFQSMQSVEKSLAIETLKPFEDFFKKYTGTTSYLILKNELDEATLAPIDNCFPQIIVPIQGLSGLHGIILFGEKILGEEYSPGEISYINRLMKFMSISIQNNIHYEHSVKDAKTGLYNHNFFLSRLKEEVARSKRNHSIFSIMVMDIDKFKNFNDTYGHLAGDEVILSLAATLKAQVREGDILSRFGGEEFTVLLPDTTPDHSWLAAERLRHAVEEMETVYQGTKLSVTISIGIASIHPYSLGTAEDLIKRADEALYQSKEKGRNQSTHYRSGLLHQALDCNA
ncbi:MAG: GGDEF domain-containing protein [Spirochaetales bacterium]|nr:GGDEF domain-containing protein [Spirochaetales bacterium]